MSVVVAAVVVAVAVVAAAAVAVVVVVSKMWTHARNEGTEALHTDEPRRVVVFMGGRGSLRHHVKGQAGVIKDEGLR